MAVRLQIKLGVVAESERLEDSPDSLLVHEPTVGSVARSKGHLYVIVTALGSRNKLREATRMAAEMIRDGYFYDESAGIVVCIEKTMRQVNKRLVHQRDRLGLGPADARGPIGVALAVVRGSELYVTTVGPVEAYLVRRASLLTLPEADRERGLPLADYQPRVWRGEVVVGDSLALVSSNVSARLGLDELKDALVTLHPQSAVEHLHHRFIAADGHGSDAVLAFEIAEVSATQRQKTLVPGQADEPLAGAPERSPIPLADSVSGGVAAVQASARSARSAAGNVFVRSIHRLQDLLPRRGPRYRRVTPASTRRETQRRAAIAVLAFVAVLAGLGVGAYVVGAPGSSSGAISTLTEGEKALAKARENLRLVFDNSADLVTDDPQKALRLLGEAYTSIQLARASGVPEATAAPVRARIVWGLERLYGVVPVASEQVYAFPEGSPAVDLRAIVIGPDGAPFVLDAGSKAVYRIDQSAGKATAVLTAGQTVGGAKVGTPRHLTTGGQDVLVLDDKNQLWRWRAADAKGKGTLARIRVNEATRWGDDVRAIGTFVRNFEASLYNLYVVDPSEQQVLYYTPQADGGRYPGTGTGRLSVAQDVSGVTGMYIDGDIYLVNAGAVQRFINGREADWKPAPPGDTMLRAAPSYSAIAAAGTAGTGNLYLLDALNGRVIAVEKATGKFIAQYRAAGLPRAWTSLRGVAIVPRGSDLPPTLYWIDGGQVGRAILQAVPEADPSASPSPSPSASPSPSLSPSPGPSVKPTKKPTTKPTPRPTRRPRATARP